MILLIWFSKLDIQNLVRDKIEKTNAFWNDWILKRFNEILTFESLKIVYQNRVKKRMLCYERYIANF